MKREWTWSIVTLGLVIAAADAAQAYRTGRIDFSGREGSCLQCHGANQGPGVVFELENATAREPCAFENEEGELVEVELPLINFGATHGAVVRIDAPAAPNEPKCPTNDCCDPNNPPAEGAECLDRPGARGGAKQCTTDDFLAGCCEPGLSNCGQGFVAGFNAEAVANDANDAVIPGGTFIPPAEDGDPATPAPDSQLLDRAGEPVTNQITHTTAKSMQVYDQANMTLGPPEAVEWRFEYQAPAAGEVAFAPQIWVGANIANGNGFDDKGDLNSNFRHDIVLTDGTEFVYPAYCAVCGDGRSKSNCCGCSSTEGSDPRYVALAALSLLGFALIRRRRR